MLDSVFKKKRKHKNELIKTNILVLSLARSCVSWTFDHLWKLTVSKNFLSVYIYYQMCNVIVRVNLCSLIWFLGVFSFMWIWIVSNSLDFMWFWQYQNVRVSYLLFNLNFLSLCEFVNFYLTRVSGG